MTRSSGISASNRRDSASASPVCHRRSNSVMPTELSAKVASDFLIISPRRGGPRSFLSLSEVRRNRTMKHSKRETHAVLRLPAGPEFDRADAACRLGRISTERRLPTLFVVLAIFCGLGTSTIAAQPTAWDRGISGVLLVGKFRTQQQLSAS